MDTLAEENEQLAASSPCFVGKKNRHAYGGERSDYSLFSLVYGKEKGALVGLGKQLAASCS